MLRGGWCCFVVPSGGKEYRQYQFFQLLLAFIGSQQSCRGELTWSPHRPVDRLTQLREGPVHVVRPRITTAEIPLVVLHNGGFILRRIEGACTLVLRDHGLSGLWQRPLERFRVSEPTANTESWAGEDQATDAGRFGQHVVCGKHCPPRVTKDVYLCESQRRPKSSQFFHETLDAPEIGVSRLVSSPSS